MTESFLHEALGQEPPLIKAIDDLFLEAYQRQMAGATTPIHEFTNVGGESDAIALNPKTHPPKGDNVRYIISGRNLNSEGIRVDIDGDEDETDVKYVAFKVTLPPDNARPIEKLFVEEATLKSFYLISEDGRVMQGPRWLEPAEVDELTSGIEGCELAPEVPDWAQATR